MRVSTNLFYDRAAQRMGDLNARASTLQTQIATGKKYTNPSENVAASQQLAELDRKDAGDAVFRNNMTVAGSLLKQTDSTLDAITEQLQRAVELTMQASNGTLSAADRQVIGNELASVRDTLMGLANARDARGRPLFGSPEGSPAVEKTPSGYAFNAAVVSDIPIADGQMVQATESAARVFRFGDPAAGEDVFTMLSALAEKLQNGGDAGQEDMKDLLAAGDNVSIVRASVGARAARVELQQAILVESSADREELRSAIEDVDATAAIVELQKTMTILSATQSSFTKLQGLSLFDYMR
jgi:flagellar hook-associated protein 3 FlgL